MTLLNIKNASAQIGDKQILNKVTLSIAQGEIVALMGKNGSGKSTLSHLIMGNPSFELLDGTIEFNGTDLSELDPSDRAKLGIFLAFQTPAEVEGVRFFTFLLESYRAVVNPDITSSDFLALVKQNLAMLSMDASFLQRGVNEGFSGGEKRKAEVLMMLLLKPKLVILDEIDSGLDVDALSLVSKVLNDLIKTANLSVLVITHYARLLSTLVPDKVYVLDNGQIVKEGDATLAKLIDDQGFSAFN